MDFLYGFLGALACFFLISGGFMLGWSAKKRDFDRNQRVTAASLSEEERRFIKDQHDSFNRLQNYSVEDAYNLHPKDKIKESDG